MTERLVLGLDTSFGPVSAGLVTLKGEHVASFEADNPPGTQAETLPPRVAEMFATAGVMFAQLDRIAVTVGPGAFTGVRVGLAFAKGLRLATSAVILGVTTLECLAAQAGGRAVGVAIDAKRGEVYAQAFDAALAPLTEASVLPVAEAAARFRAVLREPFVLTGSGASLVADAAGANVEIAVHGRIDTRLLARRMIATDPARYPPTPAYLRAPDARLPS